MIKYVGDDTDMNRFSEDGAGYINGGWMLLTSKVVVWDIDVVIPPPFLISTTNPFMMIPW